MKLVYVLLYTLKPGTSPVTIHSPHRYQYFKRMDDDTYRNSGWI